MNLSAPFRFYLLALVVPIGATIAGFAIDAVLHHGNISLAYLLGVVIVALRTGTGPAILGALVSFSLYNFFFTSPRYTFLITEQEDVLTISLFLIVAAIAGQQAVRLRRQLNEMQALNRLKEAQFELLQKLSTARKPDAVLAALISAIEKLTGKVSAVESDLADTGPIQEQGLTQSFAGEGVKVFLLTDGSMPVARLDCTSLSDQEADNVRENLIPQANLSLSRARLASDVDKERMDKQREMVRSALLSSVSHDLRTPLASMIGSVTTILDLHESLTEAEVRELLEATLEEAIRLDNYTKNLLDITKLEHGGLDIQKDWTGLDEIINEVVRRICRSRTSRVIQLTGAKPLINVQSSLVIQAIFNLVENAIKYSPADSVVEVHCRIEGSSVIIDIANEGATIPDGDKERIFDAFYRAAQGDYHRAGTGLGLPIARGMVRAHGGDVKLHHTGCRGTVFRVELPFEQLPDDPESEP